MKQIVPNVHVFTGLIVGRVYLVEDPDGLTLIDAGMPLAAARIVRQLKAAGHVPTDVKRILITHAHPDHTGGLPALKELTGAQVIASAVERPFVEGRESAPHPSGTPVDRPVEDGEVINEVLGGLHVILTPGHSPGHTAYWQPDRRVLFCGDAILNLVGLTLPFAVVTPDMDENRRSVEKLAGLGASVVCFGHGPALTRDAAGALRRFAGRVGVT
jgi:glyoxylase-like metal-dependent hydrolase (beta-lactamase superfamily II)